MLIWSPQKLLDWIYKPTRQQKKYFLFHHHKCKCARFAKTYWVFNRTFVRSEDARIEFYGSKPLDWFGIKQQMNFLRCSSLLSTMMDLWCCWPVSYQKVSMSLHNKPLFLNVFYDYFNASSSKTKKYHPVSAASLLREASIVEHTSSKDLYKFPIIFMQEHSSLSVEKTSPAWFYPTPESQIVLAGGLSRTQLSKITFKDN